MEDSDRAEARPHAVNVGRALTSSLALCPGDDASVIVAREFDDRLRVSCDGAELERVLVALLRNAVDALAAGSAERRAIRVASWRTADDRVLIEISDAGGGIDSDDVKRVFDESFSTKRSPSLTGYGLAACQRLLETWGGALYVRSTSARGTSFRLELPAEPAPPHVR